MFLFFRIKRILEFEAVILHDLPRRAVCDKCLDEVSLHRLRHFEFDLFRHRRIMLFLRDHFILQHLSENTIPSLQRILLVLDRIVASRTVRDRAQKAELRQTQILTAGAEISFRRRLNPIIAIGKIDRIQIKFQYLFFIKLFFKFQRDKNFLDLPLIRFLRRQVYPPGELLRNRTGSLGYFAAVFNLHPDSAHNAPGVDSVVLVKFFILRNYKRILHILRYFINRQIVGILLAFKHCDLLSF